MKRKLILFVASMLLGGILYAQSYHWADFDYHDFTQPMIVISRVQFNGEFQNRSDIEVAAFVGDELRGRSFLFEPYPNSVIAGQYFAYAPCYYDSPGETFTFKAYDHTAEIEYDICSTELVGQNDGHGTVENPIILDFTQSFVPTYGPEHPWIPSTHYSGEGMLVVAQIQIDGELVDRASWEIGAFCENECRGVVTPLDDWTDVDLGYFAFMNVMGNDGDVINFYLYDTQNDEIFQGKCFTTINLENGGEIGVDIFGGDIFVLNFVSAQTFTKTIIGYTTGQKDNYYLLASPIGEVSPTEVNNMLRNKYDLYYFDQTSDLEWINYEGSDGNFNLKPCKGYLYANSATVDLTFIGYPYNGNGQVLLTRDNNKRWAGWNLVGNPFTETAYITDHEFYVMNGTGTEIISAKDNSVKAMEGVFVVAESDGEILTFSTESQGKGASLVMNITRNNRGNAVDRAVIRFDGESTLPKFMLNERNTKLYIPQDNKDYAVVSANNEGEMPLYFKAAENGTYNLDFSNENVDFSYLHLIDNLTGTDIDLLINPSYSFDARTTDYASRFRLVFRTQDNNNDHFAFISNGQIILTGVDANATIQVIDALGRIIVSRNAGGQSISTMGMTGGVYVLRLIEGNETRTQKIVIK